MSLGELPHFQVGYALEVAKVDAWYINAAGDLQEPAVYITRGLCRRCCVPEIILRSMQVDLMPECLRRSAEGDFPLIYAANDQVAPVADASLSRPGQS